MAVVTGASNVSPRARGGAGYADPHQLGATVKRISGSVSAASSDSSGSKFHLCDIPSNVYLQPGTILDVDGWAFAQVNVGTETDIDALVTVARAAATTNLPIAADSVKRWQPAWEALGLAADPGGVIGLWAHASANATVAGAMPFVIEYLEP